MKEIIVDELPESCRDCGFNAFVTYENSSYVYYCKALSYLGKDDKLGTNNSEFEKNYYKMRNSRCPLKLKGYCNEDIAVKIASVLLTEESSMNKERLNDIFRYFLNLKKEN